MGRPKNTAQRRAQIVEGLLEVMSTRGYEGATVVAIAAAAGLAPGLVHYHFQTKQGILVALVERLVATAEARFAARLDQGEDTPRGRLDAWIDAHLAVGADADPGAVAAWVFVGAEAIRQDEVREVYGRAVASRAARATELLEGVLVSEGRSTARVAELAALVVAAVEGAYQLGAAVPEALPAGFAAPSVQRAVRGLVDAEPEAMPDEGGARGS